MENREGARPMKDRSGKEITTKEFMQRWKQGIQTVTPFQQVKINIMGSILVLVGVVIGLIIMFTTKTWWLFIILCGSLFLSSTSFIQILQKYFVLSKLNKMMQKETFKDEEIILTDGVIKSMGEVNTDG